MATVPLSGTNIRLLSGVPFSNDYKDTRWFDTKSQQLSYFLGKPVVHQMNDANFQRIEGRHYISVNQSIDELWGTNYLMFQNAKYNTEWFYGFVTKLEYVQPKTTYVHFQIDVFQTWKFKMNFKPSFVVREHCKLWNSDGTPVINTIDEGLDYGSEYTNTKIENYKPSNMFRWLVIVSKTPIHGDNQISPTVVGLPQPLNYYILPFTTSDAIDPKFYYYGKNMPEELSKLSDILRQLYDNDNAVNNVVSLYVTDYTGIAHTVTDDGTTNGWTIQFTDESQKLATVSIGTSKVIHVQLVEQFKAITKTIDSDKYDGFVKNAESKLLMYPYTQILLTDFKGNQVTYKPEHINGNSLELLLKGSLGTSNHVSYAVKNYNTVEEKFNLQGANEFALVNNKPNDIPIINDMLAAFIQGNRNTMQNQLDTTVWNGITSAIGGGINTMAGAANGSIAGSASSLTSTVQGAGNSVLQIQGIEAKVKDISNVPPSISKMGMNQIYETGNGYQGVYILKKQIKPEYRKKLQDFFNMFGYKVNEVKIPNFHTRTYWNYVQTESCKILGNFNNDDLQELKNIFDSGITFWHTDDVGNYALENEVIA